MKIGVISDTHNYFEPRLPEIFKGVDHILHAGDIGSPYIITQLEEIAPVTAVVGNNDESLPYPETQVLELAGHTCLVHHIIEHPRAASAPLQQRITESRAEVVVFGHTHQPFCQMFGDILYLNPGYAGRARFGTERSVALLRWDRTHTPRPKFVTL